MSSLILVLTIGMVCTLALALSGILGDEEE